ncbi:hypothetical protein AD998_05490 [bacterium 336/3]|nr:hypothetical protein AD998_05490 [bacterium 336/3]
MKNLFLRLGLTLCCFFAYLQPNYAQTMYENLWKKVTDAESKGLPETARKSVEEIYQKAKTEKNNAQLVKAVIHRLKYFEIKEEKDLVKALNQLKEEAEKAEMPTRNVLYSMLAEIYWKYYEENRWQFSGRTKMAENSEDLETWTLDKIVEEVRKYYTLSLQNTDVLQSTKIDIFDEIIYKGSTSARKLRPTLYDFLAWRTLTFYQNTEPEVTRPAYYFQINDKIYASDAENFIKTEIKTKDEEAFKFQALKIYQQLLKLNQNNESIFIQNDLARLKFVHNHSVLPQKDELYLQALENLKKRYNQNSQVTFVYHAMAEYWYGQGQKYSSEKGNQHQQDLKKAYQICEEGSKLFPTSEGAVSCMSLQTAIKQKSLSVQMEQTEPSQTYFKALLSYKNLEKIHYKIVKVNRKEVREQRKKQYKDYDDYEEKKFLTYFLAKTDLKKGAFDLPTQQDYQTHRTEVPFEGLPTGDYMILMSEASGFSLSKNVVAYAFFTVSNMAYIHKNMPDGTTEFYVLNRQTGEPIANVKAEVFAYEYNSRIGDYESINKGNFTSDNKGYFKIPFIYETRSGYKYSVGNLTVNFIGQNDYVSTDDVDNRSYYSRGSLYQSIYSEAQAYNYTHFFLDRAIYRPGQTVYFKGLVYEKKGKENKILPNSSVTVTFYDVNSQVVETKQFTTNEYGTFNGFVIAPKTGLTGQMRLHSSVSGDTYFSVEEYKRPKFEVKFEPFKGAFRLGDQVTVEGKAQAYSGANIDNSQVKYRVVRKASFPNWWWRWYGYYPDSPEIEITNGVSQTDAQGVFKINFEAIPDLSVDKASEPTFNYTVYADVTDLNGETRSSETVVKVGYKALQIGTNIQDIKQDDWQNKPFAIKTTNLMGEFESAKGEIRIYRLKSPKQAYKKRFWSKPDLVSISKENFEKMFPLEAYNNEDNMAFWEKDKEVFDTKFDTKDKKEFEIRDLKKWQQGVYLLEMVSSDKFGQEVREKMYFNVISEKSKNMAYPRHLQAISLKDIHEPNEKAEILLSGSGKWNTLYQIVLDKDVLETQWINLNDEQKTLDIPLKENYRGGIYVLATGIRNNRLYTQNVFVNIPYTNKELEVVFETYRNKLQPGEQEQWKLRIKGKKADKVAAEMVATLYDASLDVFRPNVWDIDFWGNNALWSSWGSNNGFEQISFNIKNYGWDSYYYAYTYDYDDLNWFGYSVSYYQRRYYDRKVYRSVAKKSKSKDGNVVEVEESMDMEADKMMAGSPGELKAEKAITATKADIGEKESSIKGGEKQNRQEGKKTKPEDLGDVKVRKNFAETAFFYPDLKTNENGEIIVAFTVPEALTRWKMLGFVHNKELAYALAQNSLVTQKDLMVVPNQPRFYRENDEMVFAVKVTSLAEKELQGQAQIEFFDAINNKKVNILASNEALRSFTAKAGQSINIEWKIKIPEGLQALTYKVVAKAGNFSDGEEMTLPVVTNRMLVTETMPLPIRGKQEKEFKFEKLITSGSSNTLKHQRFTLEFTSNPAWYAVQALPYMMEYPYECVEQTFSRYYANSIATHIANSNPKIKQVFDTWKNYQPEALLSNLEKNQELKSAILEETPWVLNAKDESQRKRQVALLFDLNRMASEQAAALEKVRKHQLSSGGFTWFLGFPEDRYMTQHIIAQMGHLDVMKIKSIRQDAKTWDMIQDAIRYADRMIDDDYERLKACVKRGQCKFEDNNLGYTQIQYLYARSYFKDIAIPNSSKTAFDYYLGQAKKFWLSYPIYTEGMLALALDRFGDKVTPQAMIKSFSERALNSEEFGMYWKQDRGYWWYQAPIETQALMIEVYDEVAKNQKAVEDLKVWLLKQKQTQDWKTTRATSEACFALLRRGSDALASEQLVEVTIGGEKVRPSEATETKVEAGTGYFKTAWNAEQVKPSFGNIKVQKKDDGVAWGAVYWQYFEQLDKITFAETPLSIKKQLFIEKDSDKGKILVPITDKNSIKVGDMIKVRVELRVDRDMEYVHMKDMRAAGFEPTNVISSYKYQDGLWYYESTKDMATNFFFSYLRKGTYVFEYPLRASIKGDFSNGITTIQCMYAPEFTSHSAGIRVKID